MATMGDPPHPLVQQPPVSAVAPPGRPWRSPGPLRHLPRRNGPGALGMEFLGWFGGDGWMCVFLNVSKTFLPKNPFYMVTFHIWVESWLLLSFFVSGETEIKMAWWLGSINPLIVQQTARVLVTAHIFVWQLPCRERVQYATQGESQKIIKTQKCCKCEEMWAFPGGIIWITKKNQVQRVWGS